MDYSLYYRKEVKIDNFQGNWDYFISAFNPSFRLLEVFAKIPADNKLWLIMPEYNFSSSDIPNNADTFQLKGENESTQMKSLFEDRLSGLENKSICIDITGFMRPQLLTTLFLLKYHKFTSVDIIYSEPLHYSKGEATKFSVGSIYETRQIIGFQGSNNPSKNKDLLIIAAGYDTDLISKIAQHKENAEIVQLIGFPSLSPDMYQENILRTLAAEESYQGNDTLNLIFAPASDPFETAKIVKNYIVQKKCIEKFDNIYISPLSTKAQTFGLGLMYLNDFANQAVNIIYPFTEHYAHETSKGISKVWKYRLEFHPPL